MKTEIFCPYPLNRVRVTCEGNVAMCCFQRADPLKQDVSPYLGNLLEQSFDDIWFGDLAREIRATTLEGNLHEKCRCSGCPFTTMHKPFPKQEVIYNEYPTFLEIDLPNTHCNIGLEDPNDQHPACVMCERAAPWFTPENNHLQEVLQKIANIVPNLQQIHVQGLAEPFWKGLLFEVLDWLNFDDYKYQCTISVTTNGTVLNQKQREEYLSRCPNSITNFSIDAATPETYKAIRRLPLFDHLLDNMYAFNKARVRTRQFLRVCNNINTINIHEAVAMVPIAAKADAEYIEFNPTDGFNWKILVNDSNCGQFKKVQDEIIAECVRLKVPYNFIRPLDMGRTDRLVNITL